MRLYHLFVVVFLHFTKGLLKRNDEYVLIQHLENQSCIKYGHEFVHENISIMQCMALCSNGPSCSHICYVRDIGRCIGCSFPKILNLEPGSRVFLKGLCLKKELTVRNGGYYGVWGEAVFCQNGSYAVGYALKIQAKQFFLDDTSVNALGLLCSTADGIQSSGLLVPGQAEFGEWTVLKSCPEIGHVFKAFQMQVEEVDFFLDASSVNFVRFQCAPLYSRLDLSVANTLELSPGYGFWGSYGSWSEQCDYGQGVCGIKVKLDQTHESDRTGLNNVILYCC